MASSDLWNNTLSCHDSLQGRYSGTVFYAHHIYRGWNVVTPEFVSFPYVLLEKLQCGGIVSDPVLCGKIESMLRQKPHCSLSPARSPWAAVSLKFPMVPVKWVPNAIFQTAQMLLLAASLLSWLLGPRLAHGNYAAGLHHVAVAPFQHGWVHFLGF